MKARLLPAVTLSAMIKGPRKEPSEWWGTGLVHVNLDEPKGDGSVEQEGAKEEGWHQGFPKCHKSLGTELGAEAAKEVLVAEPWCLLALTSAGCGVRAVVPVLPVPVTPDQAEEASTFVHRAVEELGWIPDACTRQFNNLAYVTHDPKPRFRDIVRPVLWRQEAA